MGNLSKIPEVILFLKRLLTRKLEETEAYLEPGQTSKMEFFCCKNS